MRALCELGLFWMITMIYRPTWTFNSTCTWLPMKQTNRMNPKPIFFFSNVQRIQSKFTYGSVTCLGFLSSFFSLEKIPTTNIEINGLWPAKNEQSPQMSLRIKTFHFTHLYIILRAHHYDIISDNIIRENMLSNT